MGKKENQLIIHSTLSNGNDSSSMVLGGAAKEQRRKEGGIVEEGAKQLLQGWNARHECKISEKCLGFSYS